MTIARTTLLILAAMLATGVAYADVPPDWAARFGDAVGAGGTAVAVDPAGNSYVAGTVYRGVRGFDFVTLKIDGAGTQLWSREFNGIGSGLDYPVGIAIDGLGNIVVTGTSFRGPTALNYEIVTRAYAPNGDSLWLARYNGTSARDDRALALAVDADGNSYVAGYANGTSLSSDAGRAYVTIKYGPTGSQLWASTFPMTFGSGANAIAVDPRGSVYVTGGGHEGNPTFGDYVTIKYTALGATAWVGRYGDATNDEAKAVAVDDSGSVYVTGRVGDWSDIATVKYDSTGSERWARRYDGPAHEGDVGVGIAVDPGHNVYVTGRETVPGAANNRDIVTMKYSTAGDSIWLHHYDGPSSSYDDPLALRIDGAGNAIVLGQSIGPGSVPWNMYNGYLTLGYGPDGDTVWNERYDGPEDGDESPGGFALGTDGSIYVTGTGPATVYAANGGMVTVKYSRSTVDVAHDGRPHPGPARLSWSHPNPCSQSTNIHFALAAAERVSLRVYDLQGREVARLADDVRAAGPHAIRWDASAVPHGVYFYRLQAGARHETRTIAVIR